LRTFLAIARTGLVAVALHPLRSAATLACLVALLTPHLVGSAVSRGLLDQAELAIGAGPDVHVAGRRFGRPAPVPLAAAPRLQELPGVRSVTPRIVGGITLGKDALSAVVVGIPPGRWAGATEVEGRMFASGASHELVLGAELARRLAIEVGALVPPFYRNPKGERVATVVGIFSPDEPVAAAHAVFCSFETAAFIFDQEGLATDLVVECEPGKARDVKSAVLRLEALGERDAHGPVLPAVLSRPDMRALLPRTLRHLDGIFQILFVIAFAAGIPLLTVASGVGLSERRREAALLRATGWMLDELLLRGLAETLVLCVLGASIAVLLAGLWLGPLRGAGLASIFLPGAEPLPVFAVPYRLAPGPALLTFGLSFAIVGSGTLYSTWRATLAAPALALR
jgi:ABC-type lipoprotein release transport system permease subunit